MHRNLITNQVSVHLFFDELERKHFPILFDSLYRALHDHDMAELTFNQELHCVHLAWLALASNPSSLDLGGRPLAITLIDLQTRPTNFKARFDAFSVFLANYEAICAEPIIRILQFFVTYQWTKEPTLTPFRRKCLLLLKRLYSRHASNPFLSQLFENDIVATTALSERYSRLWAESFRLPPEQETLLDHPYIFSSSRKLAMFEFWVTATMEAHHKSGWGLRRLSRHFYNLGFRVEYPLSTYLGVQVDRKHILRDITAALTQQSLHHVWKPIKVKFVGEQGIDLAGLTSDLLARAVRQAIERCLDLGYLRENKGLSWFQEGVDQPDEFKRLGVLIGLAMYNGVKSLPLDFPPMFYKKLVGETLTVDDMRDFDFELYRGWKTLLDEDIDGLTYEYTYKLGSEVRTHIMEYDNEEPKLVTARTREHYIQSLFTAATDTLIASPFNALLAGLESIIPRRVLRFFTSAELFSLLAGTRILNVPDAISYLQQVTVYDGYTPTDPVIEYFWEVLSSSSPSQLAQFLDFVTSSDRLPRSNFKLTIFKSGTDEEM
jgi:HECT-domain (ubiquitin-transferase)